MNMVGFEDDEDLMRVCKHCLHSFYTTVLPVLKSLTSECCGKNLVETKLVLHSYETKIKF